jgi:hypothetical protein
MGWALRLVGGDLSITSNGFERSVPAVGVVAVLSPFGLRSAEIES